MTHSPLHRFTFRYQDIYNIPLIPVCFYTPEGTPSPTFNSAILDTGASEITIPKSLADLLKLPLQPRDRLAQTAGGAVQAYTTTGSFSIGRGGRVVKYTDVNICVMENCPAILIGINPVFLDYTVTLKAYERKCILEPQN